MSKVYRCVECHGQPVSYRTVRIKRRDGDYLERWPSMCGLCEGEGKITRDQLAERVSDELLCEYMTRLADQDKPPVIANGSVLDDIPF